MPTKRDVIERAYRFGGIVSEEEPMTPGQFANGEAILNGIWHETNMQSPLWWTVEDVPDEAFLPLAMLLSHDLCVSSDVQPRTSRGKALLRLLATVRPDDRKEIPDAVFY